MPTPPTIFLDKSYYDNVDAFSYWWKDWGLGPSEELPIADCKRFLKSGPWAKREPLFDREVKLDAADRARTDKFTHTLATHAPASAFIWKMFSEDMARPSTGLVLFTAGGCGSGKSSSLRAALSTLVTEAELVCDSTLANEADAQARIALALSSGRTVAIAFIFRPLEQAALALADRFERHGPWIPLDVLVRDHIAAINTFLTLAHQYRGEDKIRFLVFDCTGDPAKALSIPMLEALRYVNAGETTEEAVDRITPLIKAKLRRGIAQSPAEPQGANEYAEDEVELESRMSARACAAIVNVASQFKSKIEIVYGNKRANAKRHMDLLTLGLPEHASEIMLMELKTDSTRFDLMPGVKVRLNIAGVDAIPAMQALQKLFRYSFQI